MPSACRSIKDAALHLQTENIIEKMEFVSCSCLVIIINLTTPCSSDKRKYALPRLLEKNGVLWNYS